MAILFSRSGFNHNYTGYAAILLAIVVSLLAILPTSQFLKPYIRSYSKVDQHLANQKIMAWMSSGSSNAALIANLANHKLITSDRVRNAMLGVDRGHYSPALPYQDSPQPIGFSATISAPHMHAAAAESLLPFLYPGAKVLDIGSGSGYLTHVLSKLVGNEGEGNVVGVDHIQGLIDLANNNMSKSEDGRQMLKNGKVKFVKGDGRKGWMEGGPYDAIHVGAAAVEAHPTLLDQLKSPGRLFIPVGDSYSQYIWVIDKDEDGKVKREKSFGVRYVPLTDEPTT